MRWLGFPPGHEFRTESIDDLLLKYTGVDKATVDRYKQRLGWNKRDQKDSGPVAQVGSARGF